MNNLTPEEKAVGRDNYYEAVAAADAAGRFDRRDFLKGVIASGAVTGSGLGAMYFGYSKVGDPVRVGVIGTGDEGGVLIGAINPDYMQVVAVADVRPSSIHRAFHGDWGGSRPAFTHSIRPGLVDKYGWSSESEARKHVKVYDAEKGGYEELLKNPDVEAVIIALPLHLHAPVSIAAMQAGKHVLTEKLMAHSVGQCKQMVRTSRDQKKLLATGHQRHYSILYDNAVNLLRWGLLGEIQFIRAQWHRGNLPGRDSWEQPVPGGLLAPGGGQDAGRVDPIADRLKRFQSDLKNLDKRVASGRGIDQDRYQLLQRQIAQWSAWDLDKTVKAEDHGYESITLENGYPRSALEELVRWRLWDRTGGGLMAELGSHQLDAASIFISALRKDGKKAQPLTVHAVGGRHTFPYNRDADDHVYCTFEFPGPGYDFDAPADLKPAQRAQLARDKFGYYDAVSNYPNPEENIPSYDVDSNKRIIVTYSSIMGNGFGGYGEVVLGSKGTLVLEKEQEVMLYKGSSTSSKIKVRDEGSGGAVLDTQASGDMAAVAKAADTGPVSRGYTEEMEHFAWCIRNADPANQPRCHGDVALADAVIALTSKLAISRSKAGQGGFITFRPEWFDAENDATPEEEIGKTG
ncbi:MAG: Gfo/Idh/MocA family oxidoreductase [Planctomycetota bacterium]|nr:Gfo/Idh/MocA family oxidoreductase [Planctomycetota bacterium]